MKNRRARCQLAFLLLLFLLVILAALSVSVGSVSLSFQDIQAILSGADRESTAFCGISDFRAFLRRHCLAELFPHLVFCFRPFLQIPLRDRLCWAFLPGPSWWWLWS